MLPPTLLLLALLLPFARAEALPALFFDGTLAYSQASQLLTLSAPITATEGLSLPLGAGSEFHFIARFASLTTAGAILATLDPVAATPGVEVVDGGGTALLLGDLGTAALGGGAGSDLGILAAQFHPTAGALRGNFGDQASLFALTLNLSTPFSPTLFETDFSGAVDGRIQAVVPEPATGLLLLLGLPLLLFATPYRTTAMRRSLFFLALLLLPAGPAGAALTYPALDLDTFAGDAGYVNSGGGAISLDGTAYELLTTPATPVAIAHVPFSLVANGTSGTLAVGAPGSELLTATFDNFHDTILTLLGHTNHTFTADLAYTGGTYAGILTTGRIEGVVQPGGAFTARLGALSPLVPAMGTVPEPTSLLLLGSATCLFLARRRLFR